MNKVKTGVIQIFEGKILKAKGNINPSVLKWEQTWCVCKRASRWMWACAGSKQKWKEDEARVMNRIITCQVTVRTFDVIVCEKGSHYGVLISGMEWHRQKLTLENALW